MLLSVQVLKREQIREIFSDLEILIKLYGFSGESVFAEENLIILKDILLGDDSYGRVFCQTVNLKIMIFRSIS